MDISSRILYFTHHLEQMDAAAREAEGQEKERLVEMAKPMHRVLDRLRYIALEEARLKKLSEKNPGSSEITEGVNRCKAILDLCTADIESMMLQIEEHGDEP